MFLPTFHCELDRIELYWGLAKWHTRGEGAKDVGVIEAVHLGGVWCGRLQQPDGQGVAHQLYLPTAQFKACEGVIEGVQ